MGCRNGILWPILRSVGCTSDDTEFPTKLRNQCKWPRLQTLPHATGTGFTSNQAPLPHAGRSPFGQQINSKYINAEVLRQNLIYSNWRCYVPSTPQTSISLPDGVVPQHTCQPTSHLYSYRACDATYISSHDSTAWFFGMWRVIK